MAENLRSALYSSSHPPLLISILFTKYKKDKALFVKNQIPKIFLTDFEN
jgi:hypothetical protein